MTKFKNKPATTALLIGIYYTTAVFMLLWAVGKPCFNTITMSWLVIHFLLVLAFFDFKKVIKEMIEQVKNEWKDKR